MNVCIFPLLLSTIIVPFAASFVANSFNYLLCCIRRVIAKSRLFSSQANFSLFPFTASHFFCSVYCAFSSRSFWILFLFNLPKKSQKSRIVYVVAAMPLCEDVFFCVDDCFTSFFF